MQSVYLSVHPICVSNYQFGSLQIATHRLILLRAVVTNYDTFILQSAMDLFLI